jgi:HEAT repeat protein
MRLPLTLSLLLLFLAPVHADTATLFRTGTPDEIVNFIDGAVQRKTKDKEIQACLIEALNDGESNIKVRERAAWALGELGVKSSIRPLMRAAKNKGLLVRSAALGSLTRLRAHAAIPVFTDIALNDPVFSLRQRATLSLGLLQSAKAIPTLVKLASDEKEEIRGAVALAMAATHSTKNDFSEALQQMAGDSSPYVRERAEKGLAMVRKKRETVQNQLQSQDSDIRLFAAVYFQKNGTPKDVALLKDAANVEPDDDVRHELTLAVKAAKKRTPPPKHRKKPAPSKQG